MTRAARFLAASLVVLATLTACGASAQPAPTQRTSTEAARGLALERVLTETGLELDELVVPSDPRGAVRLELRDAQSLAVLVDVRVLSSAREARERLSSLEPSLSSLGVVAMTGMGDAAFGDEAGTVLALARGNVLVVLRAIPRETVIDLRALAAATVRACDASPTLGREGASPALAATVVPALQGGGATIALPRGYVALRVDVEGEGLARRGEGDTWIVERARDREDVHVTAVDALLRVAR
jgi:hypothetical protein